MRVDRSNSVRLNQSLIYLLVRQRCLFPASVSAAANGDQAREDRERDLGRSPRAKVQPDWALDPVNHLLIHAFRPQRLEVVPGVAPAADQPDEARIARED